MTDLQGYSNLKNKVTTIWTRIDRLGWTLAANSPLLYTKWNNWLAKKYFTISELNDTWGGVLYVSEDAFGKVAMPADNLSNYYTNHYTDPRIGDWIFFVSEATLNFTSAFRRICEKFNIKCNFNPMSEALQAPIVSFKYLNETSNFFEYEYNHVNGRSKFYHNFEWFYYEGATGNNITHDIDPKMFYAGMKTYSYAPLYGNFILWAYDDFWQKEGKADNNGIITWSPNEWMCPFSSVNQTERPLSLIHI